MPMISYAQNREDVVLARAFPRANGFYVDVGAAHPVGHSVTKWFYDRGWTGINIEPLPQFFRLITEDRPRDVNLNMVASDRPGECTLYEVPNSIGTSTVNPALAGQIAQGGTALVPHTVAARTLRDICEEFVGDRTIDFLKIDAEGHEPAVLRGADFARWRPRVLVVENTDVTTWHQLCLDAGYTETLFDGLNRYFVRNEEPELRDRLNAPANCLDDYVPHEFAERIAHLERELRELKAAKSPEASTAARPAFAVESAPARLTFQPRPPTAVEVPPQQTGPAFYDHGCQPSHWSRWPAVAARRVLRRLQRPFYYSLRGEIESLRGELAHVHGVANGAHRKHDDADAHRTRLANEQCLPPHGLIAALDGAEWAARSARAAKPAGPTPRVLFAVSSGSQLYSGIGRAIFETTKRCRGSLDYEFAIDDHNAKSVETLKQFCDENDFPLHVGPAGPGTGDPGNEALPDLLRRGGWDAVECVSFANAATNAAVLDGARDVPVIYTPHFQPMWTIPATPDWARNIDRVHGELLRRAALVACDTPWEWMHHRAAAAPGVDCALLPLGFDPDEFVAGPRERRPYLLFVGDLVETRKRFPLTLEVFAELLKSCPGLQLVVVGNGSETIAAHVPPAVRSNCVPMGYVAEGELRTLYREAAGLLLLSDFEAFGLPILEALACGTPVFLSRRPTVAGAFGRYRGAVFVDDDSPARMADRISDVLAQGAEFVSHVLADRPRLVAELSWDVLAAKRVRAVRAALANRGAARIRLAA